MAAADYPTIEPTSFDVVLCGTGLPEAVLAAACAAAGKTVLHVDPNPFYGSLSSSLPPLSVPSFLIDSSSTNPSTTETTIIHLQRRSLYSEMETSGTVPEPGSKRFTVDLVGPRVLYCADEAVDLLLRSGGSNHVEFKSLDGGTLIYWDGELCPVPESREAIFLLQDTALKCLDKKTVLFTEVLPECLLQACRVATLPPRQCPVMMTWKLLLARRYLRRTSISHSLNFSRNNTFHAR